MLQKSGIMDESYGSQQLRFPSITKLPSQMSRIFSLELVKADDIARSLQGFAHLVFLVVTSRRPLGGDDDSHLIYVEVHVSGKDFSMEVPSLY